MTAPPSSPEQRHGSPRRTRPAPDVRLPAPLSARLGLARAVDAKDPSTRRHSERVADLSWAIAGALGWKPDRRRLLHEAAVVHDVGKIAIPDQILFKPARLSESEYETVKDHSRIGAEMLEGVLTAEQVALGPQPSRMVGGGRVPGRAHRRRDSRRCARDRRRRRVGRDHLMAPLRYAPLHR